MAEWTRAVTVEAPAAGVWPWIVQIGADRAGWYSYDCLDNGGRVSATSILPEHQGLVVGQVIPAVPGATDAFLVAEIDSGCSLVLTVPAADGSVIVSWVFLLKGFSSSRTRLIVRARVNSTWRDLARSSESVSRVLLINRIYRVLARLPEPLMVLLGGIGHGIMEGRMLQTIKRRVEDRS